MTLLDLNRAVCAQAAGAALASGTGAELVEEDLSAPILRPSLKVVLDSPADVLCAHRAVERSVTFRLYFFAADASRPKGENLAMEEALSDAFVGGVATGEGIVPLEEGISFAVTDGVLTAAFELVLDMEIPETGEIMETLNFDMEGSS